MRGFYLAAAICCAGTCLAACDGRPLLYQLAPSEMDVSTLAVFQKIDEANKGQLTRAEIDAYFKRRFAELDRDHDGFVEEAEVVGLTPVLGLKTPSEFIFRLDFSGDGKLSEAEFLRLTNYLMTRDHNKDGILTLTEVKTPPSDNYVESSSNKPGLSLGTATSQGQRP